MFQTELNLWLQTFDSAFLINLMNMVSDLGNAPVYVLLFLGFSFGAKLRQGMAVLVALMICQLMTDTLKITIAFPRPDDIDSRIIKPGEEPPVSIIDTGGAPSFFALPPAEAIEAVRADPESGSYGIPSGHTSAAAAFFFGLAFFFRSKRLLVFACFWVPLMALSRMYLGRHFLGDVLGGVTVGMVSIFLAGLLLRSRLLDRAAAETIRSLLPLTAFAFLIVLVIPFIASVDTQYAGMLWGGIVAYSLLALSGPHSDDGTGWQRTGRVSLAILLYVAANSLLNELLAALGWEEARIAEFVVNLVVVGTTLCGAITISRSLDWYRVKRVAETH